MKKPFFDIPAQYQAHKKDIDQAILAVLASGQFIGGPEVKQLEQELQHYTGSPHCITCANGTDALQIAMMAIGVEPGDEIITTPFTFIATAETISLLGATPVFSDIQENSFLLDPSLLADKITPKTKAIIPVSLYGQIADMDEINAIAAEYSQKFGHKIYVIEDAAQSFGAEYKGKKSCNTSDIATASFFPTKPLACYGDGGAIFTKDEELATIIRQICSHGQDRRYHHIRIGVNSRLDTIQAAVLLTKLKYFDQELVVRQRIAEQYQQQFANTDIITPQAMPDRTHVYGQYTLRVEKRDQFIQEMTEQGIPTAIHYPMPLNRQPAFAQYNNTDCSISDKLSEQVVSLPMCLYG